MQGCVLLGLSASSQRPGSGQVTRRCCSPPPQASEHWGWVGRRVRPPQGLRTPHLPPHTPGLTSLQEEVYQPRQGWALQCRRAGGFGGPGWQWKGRSGRRSRVSTHSTSRTEIPPPQLREHWDHTGPSEVCGGWPGPEQPGRSPRRRGQMGRGTKSCGGGSAQERGQPVVAGGAGSIRWEGSRHQEGSTGGKDPRRRHLPRPAAQCTHLTPAALVPHGAGPQVAAARRLGPASRGAVLLSAGAAAHGPPDGAQATGGGALWGERQWHWLPVRVGGPQGAQACFCTCFTAVPRTLTPTPDPGDRGKKSNLSSNCPCSGDPGEATQLS